MSVCEWCFLFVDYINAIEMYRRPAMEIENCKWLRAKGLCPTHTFS